MISSIDVETQETSIHVDNMCARLQLIFRVPRVDDHTCIYVCFWKRTGIKEQSSYFWILSLRLG